MLACPRVASTNASVGLQQSRNQAGTNNGAASAEKPSRLPEVRRGRPGVYNPTVSKHDRLPWDAEELYPTEGARRRAYRRLQSWYREQRLGAPYAWTKARSATASRGPVPARRVG